MVWSLPMTSGVEHQQMNQGALPPGARTGRLRTEAVYKTFKKSTHKQEKQRVAVHCNNND